MTALSLSNALSGGMTACGGPRLGACDLRSGLAAPGYAASIAWGLASQQSSAWPSAPGYRLSPRGSRWS